MASYGRQLVYLILIPVLFIFSFCQEQQKRTEEIKTDSLQPVKTDPLTGNFGDSSAITIDSNYFLVFFRQFPLLKNYQNDLKKFYSARNYQVIWYNSEGLTEQASNLFNHLNNLEEEGISTKVPYADSLDRIFNDPDADQNMQPLVETLLTAEYLFYADRVLNGISKNQTDKLQWFIPRKKIDLSKLADSLVRTKPSSDFSAGDYNFVQYNQLKTALAKYRALDSDVTWPVLKFDKKSFRKNDSSELIAGLRHRLFLLGDLQNDTGSSLFDETLETGVRAFQYRNGLKEDGIVGGGMLDLINKPVRDYIRTLIVNMERTRWIPIDLHKHFLIVNIPAFMLTAYDDDTVTFRMNVVVGKDLHKTTIFNGDLKYVVFSPYWNVPNSILKNEILPGIKRNPDYLKKNNMEWIGNTVRQKPGPKNSLGLVKFLFPNSYNIYLHDSPAKSLFNAESRAFSHGCIRLSEPQKMAEYLLKDDPNWNQEKIIKAMHAGKEKYVTLKNTVPVYIGYMTAWVDYKGKLNFRKDIYKLDKALEDAMINKP